MSQIYNILLIDDNQERFENFASALVDNNIKALQDSFFLDSEIYKKNNSKEFCRQVKELSAKNINELYFYIFKIIEESNIDIVFIDLFLKDRDNAGNNTGIELIKLLRKNILHRHLPIVLHSREIRKARELYEPTIMGGNTYFKDTKDVINSPSELRAKVFEKDFDQTKIEQNIEQHKKREFNYNLSILCALDKEIKPIKDLLSADTKKIKSSDEKSFKSTYLEYFNSNKSRILKVIYKSAGEAGELTAQNIAQSMIQDFKPQYLAMTGIAGGFKDNVNLGDVIIVRHSFNWQQGKYEKNKFLQRAEPFVIDKSLKLTIKEDFLEDMSDEKFSIESLAHKFDQIGVISKLKNKEKIDKFKIRFGPFATGSSVVASDRQGKTILELHDKASGLDMEIYAVYKAAYESNIGTKAIAIKGIVDYVDENKGDGWHEFSSYASAQVLYKLFTEYIDIG